MTRLTNTDICDIPAGLARYEDNLKSVTGKSILGVAAHSWGETEVTIGARLRSLKISVIPVTGGQGIILDFSQTIALILNFLGCNALVTAGADATGLAQAYEQGSDGVMLADDLRFVGIHLKTRKVADNSLATGRVFASALDLMTGGLSGKRAMVMGCGPVGRAGAGALLDAGAVVGLYDTDKGAAQALKKELNGQGDVHIIEGLAQGISAYPHVLEATPAENSIPDELVTDSLRVAAPGVPLGVSEKGKKILGPRLIHDKLELGVAAMAAFLVADNDGR